MIHSKRGFTLAEILLSVLIIGIIALLTIPSLIKGTNEKARMALLKGTVSNLTNAIQVELTKFRTTDIMHTNIYSAPQAFLESFDEAKAGIPFASEYKSYTTSNANETDILIPVKGAENQGALLMRNGVGIGIINGENSTTVVIDLTGDKSPNMVGADYFVFQIAWDDDYTKGIRVGDIVYINNEGDLTNLCKSGNGEACFKLVELSNYDPEYLK